MHQRNSSLKRLCNVAGGIFSLTEIFLEWVQNRLAQQFIFSGKAVWSRSAVLKTGGLAQRFQEPDTNGTPRFRA